MTGPREGNCVALRFKKGRPTFLHFRMSVVIEDQFQATKKIVTMHAPVRTADLGGWTDTWFAGRGCVCSVAVEPGINVTVERLLAEGIPADFVRLKSDQTRHLDFHTADPSTMASMDIIHKAIFTQFPPPYPALVRIETAVPAGSGLGTSASVTVALLGALNALHGRFPDAKDLAYAAHKIEVDLGLQSGVQDQFAAAFGGINFFEIEYPMLRERRSLVEDPIREQLDERLVTIFLGVPHSSSEVHVKVIASLEGRDNTALLDPLRAAALDSYAALLEGDLALYGEAMRRNHAGQARLSEFLISTTARNIVAVAEQAGARGWKVNGAGGDGGSMVVLGPRDEAAHAALLQQIMALSAGMVADGGRPLLVLPFRVAQRGVHMQYYNP